MADDRNDLNELMTALGSVVVVWGMIEDIARHFLTEVALGNDVDDRVDLIIISEIPFRTQLDILKKVAYVRRSNCEWKACMDYCRMLERASSKHRPGNGNCLLIDATQSWRRFAAKRSRMKMSRRWRVVVLVR